MNDLIDVKEFSKEIIKYENVIYKNGGQSKYGLDCAGLLLLTCNNLNINLKNENNINEKIDLYKNLDLKRLIKILNFNCKKINDKEEIKEGYILFLKFKNIASHLVYVLDNNKIIHSTNLNNCVKIEDLKIYKNNIVEIYKPNFLKGFN